MNAFGRYSFLIADFLSACRIVLSLLILWEAYQQDWRPDWFSVYIVWLIAWSTDMNDGKAARKWGSLRDRWEWLDSDGIADTFLVFIGALLPVMYAQEYYSSGVAVLLLSTYIITVGAGIVMAGLTMFAPGLAITRSFVRWNMVVCHAIIQIGGTSLWLAYQAGGPWLMLATAIGAIAMAIALMPKLKLWWEGELVPTDAA